jgi:hypothetical protein
LKKILTAFILCSGLHQFAFAQKTNVHIVVTNIKNEPYNNASLVVFHLPDSAVVLKKIIQSNDNIQLNMQGAYFVQVTATNKQLFSTVFEANEKDAEIKVVLQDKQTALTGVTIVSNKKRLIREEDDKTIVDAAALSVSSTNAFEVVEKTPGAIIDQDGNIYLTSTTPATVFINGREMKLSSADLTSLLKSLPANSVNKIEILRNPSAKYDAASSGGIINIVLNKGVKLGTNGSVNAAYFQGVYATKTAGFAFNKSVGSFNSYVNYQYTNRTNFEKLISDRSFALDSVLVAQQSYTKYPGTTHYLSAGTDWAINEKWNLGYDIRLTNTINDNAASNNLTIAKAPLLSLLAQNQSSINNSNNSNFISQVLNSKLKIDTSGSEWTNNIEFSNFIYDNNQTFQNNYFIPIKPTVLGDGSNRNNKKIFSFQSDLTLKLKHRITLEMGVKLGNSISKNAANYFKDTGNQIRIVDYFQTNTYQYKESIWAAYFQVAKTIAGFTIKPGLRFESTDISGTQTIPTDTNFSIRRKDLFPYVYIKHNLFKMFDRMLVANAIFRKSIKRPYYESLNPFPKLVDPFLYETGNPALKPQFTTNYEINVTFNDIPVASAGVNLTKDIFTTVIYQDNSTKIAYRTFDNLGKNKEYYVRLVGGIPPGGKYFFYIGGLYNYNIYNGFYQQQPFDFKRGSFTFFTFHEFKFTKTFSANTQAFLRTKALQNFYELKTFGGMSVSANKSFFNKKLNCILSVNDLLKTNFVSFNFNRDGQQVAGTRRNDTHRLGITLRYNFGIKPKEEKKNAFDTPQEVKE